MLGTRGNFLRCMKIAAFVVSVFLIGSCSTAPMKAYTGPEKPVSETVLIKSADPGINIVSCDGRKVTSTAVVVLQGEHIIEMSFRDLNPEGDSSAGTAFVKFTSEAGRTYIVDKRLHTAPGMFSPLIIDQTTGKQVSIPVIKPGTEEQKLVLIEKSIQEHPHQVEFWVAKAFLLGTLKRFGEALPVLERAIALKPDLAEAWAMKSGVLYELKRYEDALNAVDKAIRLQPNEPVLRKMKQDITKRANSGT